MSGGNWDYIQYRFIDIVEDIKSLIEKNGKEKTIEEHKDERFGDFQWYEKYPEDKFHRKYSDEVIEEFKKSIEIISKAQIYLQRLDWLLSGDDSEESFLKRLKEDLENEKKENTSRK